MAARRPLVDVGGRMKQLPAGDRLDLPLATTTEPGLMPAADKAKLNGVQSGATANSPDATLLNRANHTGTQTLATISDAGTAAAANTTDGGIFTSFAAAADAAVPVMVKARGLFAAASTSAGSADWRANLEPGVADRLLPASDANGPGFASLGYALNISYGGLSPSSSRVQLAFSYPTAGTMAQAPRLAICGQYQGSWTPWVEYWNSRDLVKQPTTYTSQAGVVLVDGSFGVGAYPAQISNLNAAELAINGFVSAAQTATGNPFSNRVPVISLGYAESERAQILVDPSTSRIIARFRYSSTPGVWRPDLEVLTTGVFNPANYSTTAQMQAAIVAATLGTTLIAARTNVSTTIDASYFGAGAVYARFTNTAASTVTIPANSTSAIPVGAEITLRRAANANLTIAPASGVVINPPAGGTLVMTQNMTATLKKVATNEWDLIGQTVAA